VASDTSPRLRRTRLTVISETPQASETSRRVNGRLGGVVNLVFLFAFSIVSAKQDTRSSAAGAVLRRRAKRLPFCR